MESEVVACSICGFSTYICSDSYNRWCPSCMAFRDGLDLLEE